MTSKQNSPWTRLLFLAFLLVIVVAAYFFLGDFLTLDKIAERKESLRAYKLTYPILVYLSGFFLYTLSAALSLPAMGALTLAFGCFFGLLPAFVLVSFASTSGASLAFLSSRYLLRRPIQARFEERLSTVNQEMEKNGASYLFTLRLIPAIPFFVTNLVMGLTPLRLTTFWWVSQLGMIPGTLIYVYAGSSFADLQALSQRGGGSVFTPRILFAFLLLGLFPLVMKFIMKKLKSLPGTQA